MIQAVRIEGGDFVPSMLLHANHEFEMCSLKVVSYESQTEMYKSRHVFGSYDRFVQMLSMSQNHDSIRPDRATFYELCYR